MQPIPKRLFWSLVGITIFLFVFLAVFHLPTILYISLGITALTLAYARFAGKVV